MEEVVPTRKRVSSCALGGWPGKYFVFGYNEKLYDCSFIPMPLLWRSLNSKGKQLGY
jgi:hypothetical protein